MSRSRTTAGKRRRQEQQRAKARMKEERREARHSAVPDPGAPVERSESQLLEDLADLHRALESAEVSLQEFEERREHIRIQLEQLQ